MKLNAGIFLLAGVAWLSASAIGVASAQEAQPSPTPAPVATEQPTFLDRLYDGNLHIRVTPYIWAPTITTSFKYFIPTLPHRPPGVAVGQSTIQVGPSSYVPKLNSVALIDIDVRKGPVDIFGDAMYVNASTNATFQSTISGPAGRVQIPATLTTNARLAVAVWEAAVGYTVARSHDADLSLFAGIREFPINLTLDYNAKVGERGIIAPSGTVTSSELANDVIVGLRGRAVLGGHWFIPYYGDVGTGNNNQSWQAFGGAGYVFNHGQSIAAIYRALNYYDFPPNAHAQKLTMAGPLLGYSFGL
jgi:hypothetical protein